MTTANHKDTRPDLVKTFLANAMSAETPQPELWSTLLLQDAVRTRATDIHVDPRSDGARIRFRIDGEVLDAAHVPGDVGQQLVNQMKVLARLDPMLSATPLESRWQEEVGDRTIDVRLTAMACHGGEKLHARLLNRERLDFSYETLGLTGNNRGIIERWQSAPDGMLLVTGPTGAGKSTMLHSVLRHFVNGRSVVLTIEDPVEYEVDGATQLQVDDEAGLSFSDGIRAMLRLDPDCMLVGELRDGDSAFTAMKAAATGHTVMSTLHARNSVAAITTLRQWGIKDGPIASLLSVVVNQRLVALLCNKCKRQRDPNIAEQDWFATYGFETPIQISEAPGCENCSGSGLRGRVGVFEVWKLTDEDKNRIASHADARELIHALSERQHEFLANALRKRLCDGDIGLSAFE